VAKLVGVVALLLLIAGSGIAREARDDADREYDTYMAIADAGRDIFNEASRCRLSRQAQARPAARRAVPVGILAGVELSRRLPSLHRHDREKFRAEYQRQGRVGPV
jgi:hypothetical protein